MKLMIQYLFQLLKYHLTQVLILIETLSNLYDALLQGLSRLDLTECLKHLNQVLHLIIRLYE